MKGLMKKKTKKPAESKAARRSGGARRKDHGGGRPRMDNYFSQHVTACLYSLRRLLQSPLSSLLTAAVMGITLALPGGMYVLLKNFQLVSAAWETNLAQVSLFLKPGVEEEQATILADQLKKQPEVATVRYISPEQALEEFRQHSGLDEALTLLDKNPLPGVLVVKPAPAYVTAEAMRQLADRVRALPGVDGVQLDMEWLERLRQVASLIGRGMGTVSLLLTFAVLFIVGNTIRLQIESRREEIMVSKLIGATDSFIRRPFVYGGMWYGIFGGVLAVVMVNGSIIALNGPVRQLAMTYQSDFGLTWLSPGATLVLFGASALLGLVGAGVAVNRHLREVEPT